MTEDENVCQFARDRMSPPSQVTWLCAQGFRPTLSRTEPSFGVLRVGRIVVYSPRQEDSLILTLGGLTAFGRRREVRLHDGERELCRWSIKPGDTRTVESPPLRLAGGFHELRLISDSDDRPSRYADRLDDSRTAYSLRLNSVRVRNISPPSR